MTAVRKKVGQSAGLTWVRSVTRSAEPYASLAIINFILTLVQPESIVLEVNEPKSRNVQQTQPGCFSAFCSLSLSNHVINLVRIIANISVPTTGTSALECSCRVLTYGPGNRRSRRLWLLQQALTHEHGHSVQLTELCAPTGKYFCIAAHDGVGS